MGRVSWLLYVSAAHRYLAWRHGEPDTQAIKAASYQQEVVIPDMKATLLFRLIISHAYGLGAMLCSL